jgi:hypothetical protein
MIMEYVEEHLHRSFYALSDTPLARHRENCVSSKRPRPADPRNANELFTLGSGSYSNF